MIETDSEGDHSGIVVEKTTICGDCLNNMQYNERQGTYNCTGCSNTFKEQMEG